jgi:hypothetical protein
MAALALERQHNQQGARWFWLPRTGGIAMATERPKEWPIGQSIACAPSGADAKSLDNSLVDELLNENKRLREIVIYLSEIIIRDVVERK